MFLLTVPWARKISQGSNLGNCFSSVISRCLIASFKNLFFHIFFLFLVASGGKINQSLLLYVGWKWEFLFFLKIFVRSCIFFVAGPSCCGMWDAASAWFDEQCHDCAQDSNQQNTGLPAVERKNLTTRPRGQPPFWVISIELFVVHGSFLLLFPISDSSCPVLFFFSSAMSIWISKDHLFFCWKSASSHPLCPSYPLISLTYL